MSSLLFPPLAACPLRSSIPQLGHTTPKELDPKTRNHLAKMQPFATRADLIIYQLYDAALHVSECLSSSYSKLKTRIAGHSLFFARRRAAPLPSVPVTSPLARGAPSLAFFPLRICGRDSAGENAERGKIAARTEDPPVSRAAPPVVLHLLLPRACGEK